MSKIAKCDGCKELTEVFLGKHDMRDKRLCRKCQRKSIREMKSLGRDNPNMVR